jgi:hypothetical protein
VELKFSRAEMRIRESKEGCLNTYVRGEALVRETGPVINSNEK